MCALVNSEARVCKAVLDHNVHSGEKHGLSALPSTTDELGAQFLRGLGHVNFPGCTSGVIEEQMLTVQNVNNRFDPPPIPSPWLGWLRLISYKGTVLSHLAPDSSILMHHQH